MRIPQDLIPEPIDGTIRRVLSFCALWALSALWTGFAVLKIWEWFVAPALRVPVVSLPAAIGMSILVLLLTYHVQLDLAEATERWAVVFLRRLIVCIFKPLFALVFAWTAHLWM